MGAGQRLESFVSVSRVRDSDFDHLGDCSLGDCSLGDWSLGDWSLGDCSGVLRGKESSARSAT